MAKLLLKDIVKVYGQDIAVRGIDLEVPDQQLTVFVGPSGCGKSTTLRMIAGLETISHGEMRLDGALVNDVPSRDRGVAMVFQSYALYPHMSVRQNLEFSLKLQKLPKAEVTERLDKAVTVLELEEQVGSPLDVFENPANQFVASFIGSPPMSLLEGTVAEDKGELMLVCEGLELPISRSRFSNLPAVGESVVAGFRSEDVVPDGHGLIPDTAVTIRARVEDSEMLGNESLLYTRINELQIISRMQQPRPIRINEEINCRFNIERMHLFDPVTGRSLRTGQTIN